MHSQRWQAQQPEFLLVGGLSSFFYGNAVDANIFSQFVQWYDSRVVEQPRIPDPGFGKFRIIFRGRIRGGAHGIWNSRSMVLPRYLEPTGSTPP